MSADQLLDAEFATLEAVLRERAREQPDKPALISSEGSLSYGDLDQWMDRVAGALQDLSNALSHRMESEIAKVDGSLRGSIIGLSDQMRLIIDGIPSRLTTMTRETIQALENNLERSFEGVANRSERLNEQFKKNATQTAEAVLDNYVEFIFLAIERFRAEMTDVNGDFHQELEAKLRALASPNLVAAPASLASGPAEGASANVV